MTWCMCLGKKIQEKGLHWFISKTEVNLIVIIHCIQMLSIVCKTGFNMKDFIRLSIIKSYNKCIGH